MQKVKFTTNATHHKFDHDCPLVDITCFTGQRADFHVSLESGLGL